MLTSFNKPKGNNMERREVNKLLKSLLDQQEQFIELVEELTEEAFGKEDGKYIFSDIMESHEFYEANGCLPSVKYLKERLAESKKRREDWLKKQSEESEE